MKAMIFAAGMGTRLKPFTDSHPKALAPICGHAMLGLVIEKLKSAGVDEFVVNIHHFGEQILDYLASHDNFGVTIHISDERERLLDTGGGILAARQWLEGSEPFIVHNADVLTDFDIREMVRQHDEADAVATLLCKHRETSRYLLFNPGNGRMRGWTNIKTGELKPETLASSDGLTALAFGGVHVVSPYIFTNLEKYAASLGGDELIPKFSITDFYIADCTLEPIYGYGPSRPYRWHDIGRMESLAEAELDFCESDG